MLSEDNSVLIILTTRIDCVPRQLPKIHGCIDEHNMRFNCYCFYKEKIITKNGWGFPFETFIYGERLKLLPIEDFQSKYKIEDVDYQIMGELIDDELKTIISCMRDSKTVARKYRRLLGANI